jgi:hypothetical protein
MQITQDLNLFAVIIMAIVYMIIGMIWYNKRVFGKMCAECCPKEKHNNHKKCCGSKLVYGFIAALVLSYVMAYFINMTEAATVREGLKIGFMAWLGFVATNDMCDVIWGTMPFKGFCINTGFLLLNLLLMGAVFSTWTGSWTWTVH